VGVRITHGTKKNYTDYPILLEDKDIWGTVYAGGKQ
jgi:hypothetical protein